MNAADAMPQGGSLSVETKYDKIDKRIFIFVQDSGTGISKENLNKVFDPFFTTKDPGKGTGLGLSVTYGIIKRHQGSIHIGSVLGVGTQIEIQLPLIV